VDVIIHKERGDQWDVDPDDLSLREHYHYPVAHWFFIGHCEASPEPKPRTK